MSYLSRLPPSWRDAPPPRGAELDLSSPALAVSQLERLLATARGVGSHADEVWPRLYIGDRHSGDLSGGLSLLGFTHVLNAAHSEGGRSLGAGVGVAYMGIEARDSCQFDLSVTFQAAADFIHRGLSSGGKVLVHCQVGVSRSAALVLAYLMLKQRLTLVEAVCAVKENRAVRPNRGFLRQLIRLDRQLAASRPPLVPVHMPPRTSTSQ